MTKTRPRRNSADARSRRGAKDPLRASELYLNRQLSWLEFNRRVLEEALDELNPLLERVKFISIFSSNLDEFFMVQVAGLKDRRIVHDSEPGRDGMPFSAQLAAIKVLVSEMSIQQRRCWNEDLLPKLREQNICIENYAALTPRERRALTEYFKTQVHPILTPLAIDPGHPFPHISNLSINLLVVIEDKRGEQVARVKIPSVIPRLVPIPETKRESASSPRRWRFVLLEDVVSENLHLLFPGKKVRSRHLFRITRDADIEFREQESESLLKTVEEEIEQRHFGFVVRLTVNTEMPAELRSWLATKLDVPTEDIYIVPAPISLRDVFQLYTSVDRPDLKDPPPTPRISEALREAPSVFDAVCQRDILFYHPYDSFSPVVEFVRQAAHDERVVAFKQTLYRVGSHSPIVDALLEARDDDTQVAVLVEVKARFDEESNIIWARALEKEGVHVAYGMVGLKTHCKIAMAVRREGAGMRRMVHLGTGNYNVSTARLYTDLGLMTADEDIASDVTDVFNYLTGYSAQTEYRKLLVAPVNLRRRIAELIEREAAHGAQGRIIMKMNSLSDYDMIERLYRASQAGVQIDLIIRGICCLRPGIPDVSENIRVVSLVGRYLEHARAFYFAHGAEDGGECLYAGSADLMRRNLDFRVEVLFPIEDPLLRAFVRDDLLGLQLRDNYRARDLLPDGNYVRRRPGPDDAVIDAQNPALFVTPLGTLRSVTSPLR